MLAVKNYSLASHFVISELISQIIVVASLLRKILLLDHAQEI